MPVKKAVRRTTTRRPGRPRKKPAAPAVIHRPVVEPMEEQIGQDGVYQDVYDGEEVKLVTPTQESLEDPLVTEKLLYEQFMNEEVEIYIHPSSERFADPRFDISVNGRSKVFERGQSYTVPRYFVEGLARAKPTHYDNQEFVNEDGIKMVRWPSRTATTTRPTTTYTTTPAVHRPAYGWVRR